MVLTVILLIIYIAFISLGLPDGLLGSAWPTIYTDLNVPIASAGIVSMIIAGGTIISSVLSNTLIKKLGSGLLTTLSVTLTAGALLGFSFSTEFYHLCIFAVPLGLGAGSVDAALNNFVALHYKAKHMNWLHAFWGIGASTGPLIMGYYLNKGYMFRTGYLTVSIIQFCLVFILLITLPLWKKLKNKYNSEEKNNVLEEKKDKLKVYKLPGFYNVLIVLFCYCALEASIGLWGSSFLVFVHDIPTTEAARWISLFYLGITAGRLLAGVFTYKFNNRQMVALGLITIGFGILLILLPLGNVTLILGFITLGLGAAPIFPSILHQTPENFGDENSGRVMGLQMASAYVGTTFMPPLFGLLAATLGYYIFLIYLPLLTFTMGIMIRMLYKKVDKLKKGKLKWL